MLNLVFIVREAYRGIPFKILSINITRIEGEFNTTIGNLTQVSSNTAKTGEVRQTLTHNHIMSTFRVPIDTTRKSLIEHRKVESNIP